MDTTDVLKWAAFTLFLVFHPQIDGPLVATVPIPPFAPRPLCNFQLALANQACAYLPSSLVPPPPPSPPFAAVYPTPPPSPEHHDHSHRHRRTHHHSHANEHDSHANERDDGNGHNETHGHGHDHGHHRHHHGHGHRKHRMTPIEQQCCKWLAQVDDECVCELLSRLPPFLARPIHEYTVRVAGSCNTTYFCGAGLLRL